MYQGEVYIDEEKCDVLINPQLQSGLTICNFSKRYPDERIFAFSGPHIDVIFREEDFIESITDNREVDLLDIREGLAIGRISLYSGRVACDTGSQTRYITEIFINTEIQSGGVIFRFRGKAGELTSIRPDAKLNHPKHIQFNLWFELPDKKVNDFFSFVSTKDLYLEKIDSIRRGESTKQ